MRVGGPARFFASARSAMELKDALAFARGDGHPVFVLGGGSNVLFPDAGFPGLVIRLAGSLSRIALDEKAGRISAGGGAPFMRLGRRLAALGFSDFLFACGIPGTVGGAVRMNAGTSEGDVSRVLISARVLLPDGSEREMPASEMEFGYRRSRLASMPGAVVLSADFSTGRAGDREETLSAMEKSLAARRAREPRVKRNFGSVFKNPPGSPPAGRLLEEAGMKGARVGGAMVAPEHANWIVNLGNATSADVLALIRLCEERVFERHGIRLEREVVVPV